MQVGEININSFGTPMKIIKIIKQNDIDVEFLDAHHYVFRHTTYSNFKKGCINNPFDKKQCGVGYRGDGKYPLNIDLHKTEIARCWSHMLYRCYDSTMSHKYKSYYHITECCEEWLNFQNFALWYEAHQYSVEGRLHLDKDIKYPGNKVYSPYHCLLVPQRINMLFSNKSNKRGLPNGITYNNGIYVATYNTTELGAGSTVEEAYDLYASAKKSAIEKVAEEYKDRIPTEVYEAMLAYEVRIENNKNYKISC